MMKVMILDYGAGNVFSVQLALKRLGVQAEVSDSPEKLSTADKILFPGVGHAEYAIEQLRRKNLFEFIKNYERPVLGICLGMQLLGLSTEESNLETLKIVDMPVKKFNVNLPVPHIGWNNVSHNGKGIWEDIPQNVDMYFVHSYYMELGDFTTSTCEYGGQKFTASLQKDNFYGVQFHPEKSGKWGEILLSNFIFKI